MEQKSNTVGLMRWWHRFLGLTILLCVASFFGSFGWLFDLLAHFRLQYFFFHLLGLISVIPAKKPVLLFSLLLLLILNGLTIFPIYSCAPLVKSSHVDLSLLEINLWRVHPQKSLVRDYLAKKETDMLILVEMTPQWEKVLSTIKKRYPHGLTVSRQDNFGLALWSRLPLSKCKKHSFDKEDRPAISAVTRVSGEKIHIIVAHPPPPKHPRYFRLRNAYFKSLVKLRQEGQRTVVIGDLNTPSWSHYFQKLCKEMKLRDSRQGFGIHATWPTVFPLFLTPLDHCLISDGLHVVKRELGPSLWSDHYPLKIQLSVSSLGRSTSTKE